MLPHYDVLEQKIDTTASSALMSLSPRFFHLISNKQGINAVNL